MRTTDRPYWLQVVRSDQRRPRPKTEITSRRVTAERVRTYCIVLEVSHRDKVEKPWNFHRQTPPNAILRNIFVVRVTLIVYRDRDRVS